MKEREVMTKEELGQIIYDEEKRLGVGSAEFIQRHQEIMEQCSALLMKGGEKDVDDVHGKRTKQCPESLRVASV